MKKIGPYILFLLAEFAFGQTPMTLQECIDFAKENNPNMKSARSAVEMSEDRVGEYLATGFPQISGNADLGNNYLIPTTFIPAAFFGDSTAEGTVPVRFGTKYVGRATIDLNQMIFSGSYFVGLKAAKTYTELSRKDLIGSEVELVEAIKKAYYSVLVNQERHSLVVKNYQRLDSLLRETRIMHENGFAEKIDVNRVQVQHNNISQAIKTSATGLEVSRKLLKFQMGMPMSDSIALADNLQTIKFQVLSDDFRSGFNYNDRIEYQKLEVSSALVELDIKNTKVQYLPTLDFYGNYGASYGTSVFTNFVAFGDNWKTFGAFGLRLYVPLFDGMMKSKQIQQKKSRLEQIEFSKQLVKNQIDMEQEQNYLMFENNLAALRAQEENMKLAEEVYKVTVIKYQHGVGSNIEVINADADYKQAQVNYFTALYDALISTVELEKAYGKLLTSTN